METTSTVSTSDSVLKQGIIEENVFPRKSREKWLQLCKPDSSAPARLVKFDSKKQSQNEKNPGKLITHIIDVTTVTTKPDDRIVLLLLNNKTTKTFRCMNGETAKDWLQLIKCVMMECSVFREGVFPVNLMPSVMLNFSGECTAIISSGLLKFIDDAKMLIAQWPLTVVKKYSGKCKQKMVIIQFGRLSCTGEGLIVLCSIYWKNITNCLDQCSQKIYNNFRSECSHVPISSESAENKGYIEECSQHVAVSFQSAENKGCSEECSQHVPVSSQSAENKGYSEVTEKKIDKQDTPIPLPRIFKIDRDSNLASYIEFSKVDPVFSQSAANEGCSEFKEFSPLDDPVFSQSPANEGYSEFKELQVKCLSRKILETCDDDDYHNYENDPFNKDFESTEDIYLQYSPLDPVFSQFPENKGNSEFKEYSPLHPVFSQSAENESCSEFKELQVKCLSTKILETCDDDDYHNYENDPFNKDSESTEDIYLRNSRC